MHFVPEIWIDHHIKFESGKGSPELILKMIEDIFIKYQRDLKKEIEILDQINPPKIIDIHTNLQDFFSNMYRYEY